jgi:hypothetical protein
LADMQCCADGAYRREPISRQVSLESRRVYENVGEFERLSDVFTDKGKVIVIPVLTAAALLASYRTEGRHWWEYLDIIEHYPEKLRDGLTIREAPTLLGKSIDSRADHNLTVAERVEKVHRFLDDPEVYAVIEDEISQSREDRRARHRARIVHSELAARQKAIEAELREMREAKSPFEATVKAELDLLRAAQLAHAVGELISDLPQQDRLAYAL